jgi:hypothetical protein
LGTDSECDNMKDGQEGLYIAYQYNRDYSIGKMCAQHLFSVIMASIAEALPTVVEGKTGLSDDDKHTTPFVKNDLLEAIANHFVEAKLGTKEEAYMC